MPRAEALMDFVARGEALRGSRRAALIKNFKFRQIFFMGVSVFSEGCAHVNCGGLSIEAGCIPIPSTCLDEKQNNESFPPTLR
jgi:hypothetical protein